MQKQRPQAPASLRVPFFDLQAFVAENTNFRVVLDTTQQSQLVAMCLRPQEDIGGEHHTQDQFIYSVKGQGMIRVGELDYVATSGTALIIPGGAHHNVTNQSKIATYHFYIIYSPPHHPPGEVQQRKPPMEQPSMQVAWRGEHVYDIAALWKLTEGLPTQQVEISRLMWVLEETFWSDAEGLGLDRPGVDISAMQVLRRPAISAYHWKAIQTADLSYPILIITLENGRLDVIDGIHRLAKAYAKGMRYISARFVPEDVLRKAVVNPVQ
jgi:mannose-6-phosphate isomerase-like protein (cupin superfamily)